MKVVLLQDVKGTGKKGDLVQVSDGYARNYLLPRKMAQQADAKVMADLKSARQAQERRIRREREEARRVAESIDGKTLKLYAKSGQGGKLFGSVTSQEVSDELKRSLHVDVDRRKIALNGEIKAYGTYECEVKLYAGVSAKLYVLVGEAQ
ncbi:MAG TPA: 50S ribosomal protein L9 [Ruminococcaceae bacterium]|jgi:large subunit ribosomal protein L9|nr:50S ribosomal protein L9 [Oscillospiraceae bacterium]HBQ46776.1 50S ribosomal protein L9 [Oscillospiraceae bacterium]HBT90450.1 50S ribosomal protein L9 [Oscillospiraceae bacterium]HCB91412.1 50S ribosomal protein L9 [Oscillospiraceae bacterium]